ncbi:sugar ABC transporter permease [Actinopolymorpha sp. B17G11]|uniref:carbohydrate ABC transporter permease n=1 Tax=Actinopolymorpha sp. B17G11 TaxID=3160861 RepID=UPI0032E39ECC
MSETTFANRLSAADQRSRRPTSTLHRSRTRFGLVLLVPFAVLNAAVIVVPSLATVFYSFTDWTGVGPASWVGLDNYVRLAGEGDFYSALSHNLIWTGIHLTVPIGLALLGAAILARIRRAQVLLRLLYFLPYTVASVVTASVWQDLLDPERGVSRLSSFLGIDLPDDLVLLGNQATALPTIAMINVWALWGFLLVIFLSAMQGVDDRLYEAARIDGANVLQEFWHVTVPGILPTLVFVVLISIMWSLLAFDYVWIITQGGPAGATELVSTLLYREAFQRFDVGYAASLGLSLTFISGLIIAGFLLLQKKGWTV